MLWMYFRAIWIWGGVRLGKAAVDQMLQCAARPMFLYLFSFFCSDELCRDIKLAVTVKQPVRPGRGSIDRSNFFAPSCIETA